MTIYIVRPGDSLYTIARKYGVTEDVLIYDNQIADPLKLVIGQALVISVTSVSYKVGPGQNLYSIARMYQTSVDSILAANPAIKDPAKLEAGQVITIPFGDEMLGKINVNGFEIRITGPILKESLPNLTYISPFSWQTDAQGGLKGPNDEAVLSAARASKTAPLMVVTNIRPGGGFSSDIAHSVLTDKSVQDNLLNNIIMELGRRNYYGLIIDFEYIYPLDRENYNEFLKRVVNTLHPLGYIVGTAIAPKISATQAGTLYEAHDYAVHGRLADFVIIMTYEWGYTYGPPMAVAPVNEVEKVLNYAVSEIPSKKILMGMPNYGYDWTLPFVQGSAARGISNTGAVTLASEVGAEIKYDEKQQAPYFNYYDRQGKEHEVWFDDARSIQARLELVDKYKLGGISYWTLDNLFRTQFIVLNSMYGVNKIM